jgi:hypothetical protein
MGGTNGKGGCVDMHLLRAVRKTEALSRTLRLGVQVAVNSPAQARDWWGLKRWSGSVEQVTSRNGHRDGSALSRC